MYIFIYIHIHIHTQDEESGEAPGSQELRDKQEYTENLAALGL